MMSAQLAAEVLKLRTTRATYAILALAAALGATMAALIAVLSSRADVSGEVGGRLVLSSGGITAGILTLLLGIATTAGEYRHGTIVPTLLVNPDRVRVVLAQVFAGGLAGAVIGAASIATTAVVSFPVLAARDVPVLLSGTEQAGIALGGIGFAALSAAVGAALGALLRNQVVAVGLALVVLFAVEPIVTGLVDGYQRFSLTGIRVALSGGAAESAGAAGGGLPPLWLAALLWTTYAVLLTLAATVGTRRRDVT
jgi:ABC-2 type transport system permease protein